MTWRAFASNPRASINWGGERLYRNPLRYEFVTDRYEEIVRPGDHVSFKTYPRGTSRGVVQISKRALAVERDEHGNEYTVPALEVVDEDGYVYPLYGGKGIRKLKKW